ncbi:hypothetical protein Pmani_026966 [Petrolisthes manimaculis]|uniref:Uncharacterized protein n=1 Tax=Petrolisthes manimaculis TaxID=1843537 RepID=A0AAE1P583_9EUCA|nr:hypothetical protein Pmani_026966 [Petrolisthes manimaculis]
MDSDGSDDDGLGWVSSGGTDSSNGGVVVAGWLMDLVPPMMVVLAGSLSGILIMALVVIIIVRRRGSASRGHRQLEQVKLSEEVLGLDSHATDPAATHSQGSSTKEDETQVDDDGGGSECEGVGEGGGGGAGCGGGGGAGGSMGDTASIASCSSEMLTTSSRDSLLASRGVAAGSVLEGGLVGGSSATLPILGVRRLGRETVRHVLRPGLRPLDSSMSTTGSTFHPGVPLASMTHLASMEGVTLATLTDSNPINLGVAGVGGVCGTINLTNNSVCDPTTVAMMPLNVGTCSGSNLGLTVVGAGDPGVSYFGVCGGCGGGVCGGGSGVCNGGMVATEMPSVGVCSAGVMGVADLTSDGKGGVTLLGTTGMGVPGLTTSGINTTGIGVSGLTTAGLIATTVGTTGISLVTTGMDTGAMGTTRLTTTAGMGTTGIGTMGIGTTRMTTSAGMGTMGMGTPRMTTTAGMGTTRMTTAAGMGTTRMTTAAGMGTMGMGTMGMGTPRMTTAGMGMTRMTTAAGMGTTGMSGVMTGQHLEGLSVMAVTDASGQVNPAHLPHLLLGHRVEAPSISQTPSPVPSPRKAPRNPNAL